MARRAIDIEDLLVWAVQRERADIHAESSGLWPQEAAAAGVAVTAVSGDGTAAIAEIARLGCRPDVGSPTPGHCHPDAEDVWVTARQVLDAATFALVMGCARTGSRPSWGAEIPAWEAMYHVNWACKAVETERRGPVQPAMVAASNGIPRVPHLFPRGRFCQITGWRDRSADIASARWLYETWWVGLAAVAGALGAPGRLRLHAVIGPAAPARPWQNEKRLDNARGP